MEECIRLFFGDMPLALDAPNLSVPPRKRKLEGKEETWRKFKLSAHTSRSRLSALSSWVGEARLNDTCDTGGMGVMEV
jgi:hypothetical protein